MSQDSNAVSAAKPTVEFESWSRSLLEEVLVRAGLQTPANTDGGAATTTLTFRIVADETDKSLTVSFERVGSDAVCLKVPLDD